MIVIIPSNREIHLTYLTPLIESGARFIIVDDSPGTIAIDHPGFKVFNWGDRKKILGPLDDYFPRRNGACRNFGFLMAWREAEDEEVIIALDDDCRIDSSSYAQDVANALDKKERPVFRGAGVHFNVLDLYKNIHSPLFPRGFPYSARPNYIPWIADGSMNVRAEFNLGLWTDAFDINAIDKIQASKWRYPEAELQFESVIVPKNALVSVCSMNMQFRRRMIAAVYQLPMHIEAMPGWVIDRYGDIWGGFILKMLMDRKGEVMTAGGPMIAHLKAGDQQRNSWQEHICHLVNDEFIDLIGTSVEAIDPDSYSMMMSCLAEEMASRADSCSPLLTGYIRYVAVSMKAWLKALGA